MVGPVTARLGRFEPLADEDVRALERALANRRTYRARTHIVREGETSGSYLAILSGWAGRHKALRNGSRQITGFMLPGDMCHINAAVGAPLDHDVVAIGEVTAALILRSEIERLSDAHPALGRAFQWSNIAGETLLRSAVVGLGRRDARERLGHLLCELWARADAVGLVRDGRLMFEPIQSDLADRLGLTSVHVNRTLGVLREQGLAELVGRYLVLPDFDQLARASGVEDAFLRAITGFVATSAGKGAAVGRSDARGTPATGADART